MGLPLGILLLLHPFFYTTIPSTLIARYEARLPVLMRDSLPCLV